MAEASDGLSTSVTESASLDESSAASSLRTIWIGVATAIIVALAVSWNIYRSAVAYSDAFDRMTDAYQVILALDAARADRTLLSTEFTKYELGGDRTSLAALAPVGVRVKSDVARIRALTLANPGQQHRLAQIEEQIEELNLLNAEILKLGPSIQPRQASRPLQFTAAAQLLDALRIELAGISAEEFRALTTSTSQARSRAAQSQVMAGVGCALIIGWLLVVVGWGARMVSRLDHKARQVLAGESALRQVNEALEARVKSRTAALAEQHNLLESILDAMSEAVVAVSAQGELGVRNSASELLLGRNLADEDNLLAGFESVEGEHAMPMTASRSPLRTVLEGGQTPELTLRKRDPNKGELRWFECSARPVAGVWGSLGGAVMVLRDVTDRELAREQLQRTRDEALAELQRRSEFVMRTGFQVRTPLSTIIGRADLLLLSDLRGEPRRHVEVIKSSADLLATIVNDVYDYSLLNTGRLTLRRVDFDLLDTVEEVVESFGPETLARGVELGLMVDSGLPGRLRGDPNRLRQILYNIISNAVRATQTGRIEINLNRADESSSAVVVNFQVSDTGSGIASELRARLFDPYVHADGDSAGGETGLGLAIAAQLIQRMNGEIGLESEVGKGSNFRFRVSLDKVSDERLSARFDFSMSKIAGAKILLVGPPSLMREAASRYLAAWGLTPSPAESGAEALEQLKRASAAGEKFWGVIVAEQAAGQSGSQIAEAIKAVPELRPIRVFVASAEPGREGSAAVDHWIRMPLMPSQLADALNSLVSPSLAARTREHHATADPTLAHDFRASARILVVEDDGVTRAMLGEQLAALGFAYDLARRADEALEMLEHRTYDAVLMDLELPGMDGYEATAEIRRREGNNRHTVVIAHTAHSAGAIVRRCASAGMDDFLAKPVTLSELAQVLDTWAQPAPSSKPAPTMTDADSAAALSREFDKDRLAEIEELSKASGQNILAKLARTFLADLPGRLAALETAIERGDLKTFASEAHALRGASGTIGAKQFANLCASAEDLARAGNAADTRTSVSNLMRYARLLPEVLKQASSV